MIIPPALEIYITGLKTHDIGLIATSFAPDIRFITPARTMERGEILEFLGFLYAAFPDWSYAHDPPFAREDGVIGVRWRQGGTHTATLRFPGFPEVAATGLPVIIPEQHFFYRVDGSGMREIRPDPIPGGAPRGIFEQIGVELPPL